ncbi:hypothetical protein Csa_023169, partial [Cucumis sativus]
MRREFGGCVCIKLILRINQSAAAAVAVYRESGGGEDEDGRSGIECEEILSFSLIGFVASSRGYVYSMSQ